MKYKQLKGPSFDVSGRRERRRRKRSIDTKLNYYW
jgi:hypothetical protein